MRAINTFMQAVNAFMRAINFAMAMHDVRMCCCTPRARSLFAAATYSAQFTCFAVVHPWMRSVLQLTYNLHFTMRLPRSCRLSMRSCGLSTRSCRLSMRSCRLPVLFNLLVWSGSLVPRLSLSAHKLYARDL